MGSKKVKMTPPVKLPVGVSLDEWSLEKTKWQNPRIRAFMGCVRVLDEVFESNYAILHCSPQRLEQMWEQVQKISKILRNEVAPLLNGPSKIPSLEEARSSATVFLEALDKSLLKEIERYPELITEEHYPNIRKLLCVAIGQLHAFLLDTLGEMLARDPRSQGDVDYFLARKFARDVDEAEWLHTSVMNLEEFLVNFSRQHAERHFDIAARLTKNKRIPTTEEWSSISEYLDVVRIDLVGHLKMILGLRGIRLAELEFLDQQASDFPAMCRSLEELYSSASSAIEAIESTLPENQATADNSCAGDKVGRVFGDRIAVLMNLIHDHIRDLITYLPVWRKSIEHRRAMMLSGRNKA